MGIIARMNSSSPSRSKFRRAQVCANLFRKLPWIALGAVALVLAWYSISFARDVKASNGDTGQDKQGHSQPGGQLTAQQTEDLSKQALDAASLKEKLKEQSLDAESAARLKDDVKGYLEWVIAIAGVFAIVGTVAAGFSAQFFTDQAEKNVVELDKFREKYEGLVVAERTRKDALQYLKDEFIGKLDAGYDWRDGFYESMDPDKRQWLLSAERYLGYDLNLDMRDKANTPAFLRLLANFYVSKFEYENRFGSGHIADLERAEYLLQLWTKSYPEQFEMRNDLGLVYSRFFVFFKELVRVAVSDNIREKAKEEYEKYLGSAYREFDASRNNHPKQQRAQYSLAFIAKERGNIEAAIDLLGEAKNSPVWERKPNPARLGSLRYNLACYQALKIAKDNAFTDASRVNQLVNDVEMLARTAYTPKDQVDDDFDNDGVAKVPKGDFYDFLKGIKQAGPAGQSAWSRIDGVRAQLSTRK
jgi:hypothetical protein